jgi:copper chaperone CopZ
MIQTFQISGMSCMGCANRLMRVIAKMDGVKKVDVDFSIATMVVDFDPAVTDLQKIVARTVETGYGAEPIV